MKHFLTSLLVCSVLFLSVSALVPSSQGADRKTTTHHKKADTASAKATSADKAVTAEKAAPAAASFASGDSALSLEKKAQSNTAVTQGLTVTKFRKQLPRHFNKLKLTEAQQKEVMKIQEEYHALIAPLNARLQRLTNERNAALQKVLTSDQKEQFKQLQPPKAPAEPKAPKKAKADDKK